MSFKALFYVKCDFGVTGWLLLLLQTKHYWAMHLFKALMPCNPAAISGAAQVPHDNSS
jgi:hypothetical protein